MGKTPRYRHELKYQISRSDYMALRQRLRTVMRPDAHAGPEGTYVIRSIYFDNYRDKALWDKINVPRVSADALRGIRTGRQI